MLRAAKAQSVEIIRKISKNTLSEHFAPWDFFENIFFRVLISYNDGICKKIRGTTKVPNSKGSPLALSWRADHLRGGGALKKICLPEIAVFSVLGPLQNPLSASLFGKTENFSFFANKILQKYRIAILKLQKDTPGSGENSRYLQCMSEVFRKHF